MGTTGQITNGITTGEMAYLLKVQNMYVSIRPKYYYKIRTNIPAEYGEWYSHIEFLESFSMLH